VTQQTKKTILSRQCLNWRKEPVHRNGANVSFVPPYWRDKSRLCCNYITKHRTLPGPIGLWQVLKSADEKCNRQPTFFKNNIRKIQSMKTITLVLAAVLFATGNQKNLFVDPFFYPGKIFLLPDNQ